MGHQLKVQIALLLALSLFFPACEKVDISGMFISNESINQRFEQSMDWNAVHPFREITVPFDDYFILSMSDSHVGETTNLDSFVNIGKTTNASALVMVGDLTTGHTQDYAEFQQHIPNQDSLPSFLMVGNHDLYFDGWNQFFSRFGSSTYLFTISTPVATDLYICLDTGGGTLGNKQLDWLKDILQTERPNYRRCIVFTHNNLFRFRHTFSTNPLIEELHVLIILFTKHKVDMVITGHDHQQYAKLFGNTTHIVMDALMDGLSNSGYFQLNVKNGNLEYEFLNF